MRKLALLLALTGLVWGRPFSSPRGLCSFDIPENLRQAGGTRWGEAPGIVIEMREEFAPKQDLKPMIMSMCPPNPNAKKKEEGVEFEGAEGKVISRTEGNNYAKFLFVRQGNYNLGWSIFSMQAPKDEVDAVFARMLNSVKFNPQAAVNEENREVRDPSGLLLLQLPTSFAARDGRRYSNGKMMLTLTTLRETGPQAQADFANKYQPNGFKVFMRRPHQEIGPHNAGLILATSDDGQLESQMVMLSSEKGAVVLTFIAPVALQGQLTLLREQVAGQATWTFSQNEGATKP